MSGLLVLGSKPDPALPPRSSFDAVACANASGYSAAAHHLPAPLFTVMSAILPAVASGRQSLRVLAGLSTETLYFFPRPAARRNRLKQVASILSLLRMQPFYLRRVLRSVGYRYGRFVARSHDYYDGMIRDLCDHDQAVLRQIQRKQPSTGATALAIGLAEQPFDRYILSGFSFELTHAYADNPEIAQRKSKVSRHAETDIKVMGYLARKFGNVFTTEATVHERAGIPLLAEAGRTGAEQGPATED
ncbi:MAG: hypothetical protein PVI91_14160 [Gammaproteobacteria bacterium]|jgi:hypothetical protein